MVRKGGFEPPRLTAPPPQDGASASSATSARGEVKSYLYCTAKTAAHSNNWLTYFVGVGAAGAGATGAAGIDDGAVGAGAAGADFDGFENCCSTELPAATALEF